MSPNTPRSPNFNAPRPLNRPPEAMAAPPSPQNENLAANHEAHDAVERSLSPERPPAKESAAQPSDPGAAGVAVTTVSGASPQAQPAKDSTTLSSSTKSEREKEVVKKAKAIIESTKDNPHKQVREIAELKIAYLKAQYNKTLKEARD